MIGHQLSIFDQPVTAPRARRRDPETSKQAAAKAASFASNHHRAIAAALAQGPANIYELGRRCGLSHVAVARRLPELLGQGRAHPTEQKCEGCRVWASGPKP